MFWKIPKPLINEIGARVVPIGACFEKKLCEGAQVDRSNLLGCHRRFLNDRFASIKHQHSHTDVAEIQ